MGTALLMAVKHGFKFDITDFGTIAQRFRPGYWLNGDAMYSAAIDTNNKTAIRALEYHWKMKPYMILGERAHVGFRFFWETYHLTVTTVTVEHIIACAYHDFERKTCESCRHQEYSSERKVKKVFKLTHEDLKPISKKVADAN